MKWNSIIFISILIVLNSCNGKSNTQSIHSTVHPIGDTVSQLSNNIMVVYQDKKNNFWLGSWQDGLYRYDGKSIIHYTTKHGLPDNRVEEIKEDKRGNVFINTKAGLIKYDGKQFISIPKTFPLFSNWGLQPDDLWFKSTKSGQVFRFDGTSLMSLDIPKSKVGEAYLAKNPDLSDPYGIYCIYKDSKGNVWFGAAFMGALRYNGKSFDWISESDVTEMHNGPANGVRSIIEDKEGYFWFNSEYRYKVFDSLSTIEKSFYRRLKSIGNFDEKKDSNLKEYLSIAKDNQGNLWIATYENGVWKYDGHKVKHYSVQENGKDIHLFYIYKDSNGDIWLGTHENGLWKLNGERFIRLKLK